ncbi:MAG: hypothetical protein J0H74_33675 [Chitinophagaceae bacterium]|nr:hypothetical protein [Chitinophagaceae bacterium]
MSNANPVLTASHPGGSGPVLRFFARLIAYIFHPLFITSYVMAFLIFFHPYAFTGFDQRTKILRLVNVVLCNAFFPAFAVLLLKLLGFISSMHLRTEKERIIPYIITMIFYWWTWNVYKHLPDSPLISIKFLLGAFLALCGGWLCNIYFKISMHGIAMGGAMMFFFLFSFTDSYASGLYISITALAAGLVATARLITGDHKPFEIYSGLIVGMLGQYIAWQF